MNGLPLLSIHREEQKEEEKLEGGWFDEHLKRKDEKKKELLKLIEESKKKKEEEEKKVCEWIAVDNLKTVFESRDRHIGYEYRLGEEVVGILCKPLCRLRSNDDDTKDYYELGFMNKTGKETVQTSLTCTHTIYRRLLSLLSQDERDVYEKMEVERKVKILKGANAFHQFCGNPSGRGNG